MIAEATAGDRERSDTAKIVAFTSLTGGIGRTGVVVNLAWTLTMAGNRVAIADWGTESPRVHDYLMPFPVDDLPPRALLNDVLVDVLLPDGPNVADRVPFPLPSARRYRLPNGRGRIDVAAARDLAVPVPGFVSNHGGGDEVERLREGIRASRYDYVLIDAPTNLSPEASARMAELCDVVAVCFLPRHGSIAPAAQLARQVWDSAPFGVTVLAVPLQFDHRDAERAEQAREAIRDAFAGLLSWRGRTGRDLPADIVDVPHHPHGTAAETLAVLVGEPGCAAAYRRLASAVIGLPLDVVPPITPRAIVDYRRAVGLGTSIETTRVLLVYAPRGRSWADWTRAHLADAGVAVSCMPDDWVGDDGATVVVISSADILGSPLGAHLNRQLEAGATLSVVVVEPRPTAEPFLPGLGETTVVALGGLDESEARTALLARFPVVSHRDVETASHIGFPARPFSGPANIPKRTKGFTGRGVELELMRDRFAATSGMTTWTLYGSAGTGKTVLAAEYAHRFAFDYSVMWWINAQDRRTITEGLVALAGRMQLPVQADAAEAAIRELSSNDDWPRWLLVYDDVDDLAKLSGLLPEGGSGHVIVITRSPAAGIPSMPALGPFEPADSQDMLSGLVPDLATRDTRDIAALVDHMPLTVHLAGSWIRETATVLRAGGSARAEAAAWAATEFRSRMAAVATSKSGSAAAESSTALRVVRIIVESLKDDGLGAAAVFVARLCGFLSPDGVSLRLLRTAPVSAALSRVGSLLLSDDLELDRVLWLGSRYGLLEVDWARPAALNMTSQVRALLLESMPLEEQDEYRTTAFCGLAALCPPEAEVDNSDRSADLRELGKHLGPSGAVSSTDPSVRRWLVSQVCFYLHDGDPEAWTFALGIAEQVLANWEPADESDVGLRMQMRFHLANLWRALGDNPKALALDLELLDDQRRALGARHPRALRTARGMAQGMRSLGNFDEALTEERATYRGLCAALGGDHPDTMRAANNLALSHFLAGATATALDLERKNYARRLELLGPGHPDVWWSACTLGVYLRELGQYPQALRILRDSLDQVLEIGHRNQRYELRIQWHRAITLRRSDKPDEARPRTEAVLKRYRALYGEAHLDVLACRMSLASDMHAIGEANAAADGAMACLNDYVGAIGTYHPFTVLCRMNLAVFLRSAGQVEQALNTASDAVAALRFRLGQGHPWTIAAANGHARALAATGNVEAARALLLEAHTSSLDYLEQGHPITKTVAGNLSVRTDLWQDVVLDVPEM